MRITSLFLLLNGALGAAGPDFNREVRPLLSEHCFTCHGPDAAARKADLRLDQPGQLDRKELIRRLESHDPEEVMPPPKALKRLSPAQANTLKAWVQAGAHYDTHWSFKAIAKPVQGQGIDDLVGATLQRRGLKPSPAADGPSLLRRVALDLTGLPPTPAEQQRFGDGSRPREMIDYFLAKPEFGEHFAVSWLDAARYADTNGYQVDRDRELWPWRDWVVRAFNANLPFDQFTIEQLAGDLLPNPTLDQRIATGFNRNHMLNEEGGVIAEEFLAQYTADRVETTAAVWMGLTFGCCRCHDHKYDPFTQRDFYALKAFFHNVPERGVGIYSNPVRTNAPPFINLPAPAIEAKISKLEEQLAANGAALKAMENLPWEPWAESLITRPAVWQGLKPAGAKGGDQPPQLKDNLVLIGPQETRANTIEISLPLPAQSITALRLTCSTVDPAASLQWSELTLRGGKLRALDEGQRKLLDGDRRSRAPLSLSKAEPREMIFEVESMRQGRELAIILGVEQASGSTQWKVEYSTSAPSQIAAPAVMAAATLKPSQRNDAHKRLLAQAHLAQQPQFRRLNDERAALQTQLGTARAEIPTSLVMEEQREMRPTFILMRGEYDKPGAQVSAATPAALPPLPSTLPANRLGLARWLVSAQHPLTARVAINRLWQHFFGQGLVRSAEDFGAQGDPPTHPELLDWLAATFQERDWNLKDMIRLIMNSATYRQSSLQPADQARRELDPENLWLSRGPRHRLAAEVIRDQALAAAGLLVQQLGGPAVKPYHPPGLYEQIVAQRDNPKATYQMGSGSDLYRRSLYTYWKRSVPHPAMLLFDAPLRETCSMRRSRSNTALQALNVMNDPTYVEAARALAARMMAAATDTKGRIAAGFQWLLARTPETQELHLLEQAHARHLADFRTDPKAAKALLENGQSPNPSGLDPAQQAAFTLLASTLLNLDETLCKP